MFRRLGVYISLNFCKYLFVLKCFLNKSRLNAQVRLIAVKDIKNSLSCIIDILIFTSFLTIFINVKLQTPASSKVLNEI